MNFRDFTKTTIMMVTLLSLFIGKLNVDASCSYEEKAKLNDVASLIKTNYEVIESTEVVDYIDPDTQEPGTRERIKTSFKISIYNLNKDIYLVEKNSLTKDTKRIFFEDVIDGVYSFVTDDLENIIRYDYDVYSNVKNCTGEVLKSYNFVKPKENMYSQYRMCQGLEDVSYCKKFITEEVNVSESELEEKIATHLNSAEKEEKEKEKNKNYIYAILGVGIVVGTAGTIYIVRKRSAL